MACLDLHLLAHSSQYTSVLHLAAWTVNVPIIEQLLRYGARHDQPDKFMGCAPLLCHRPAHHPHATASLGCTRPRLARRVYGVGRTAF